MDKSPFIGMLDRKISVVELVKSQSATGNEKTSETVVCSPFACMVDGSGSEVIEGEIRHVYKRTYVIRWNMAVREKSTALVVVDGVKKFDVVHVKEIGRRRYLELMCEDYE